MGLKYGVVETSFKHYEVRHMKCPKYSIFCYDIVWAGKTLVQDMQFGNYFA